MKLIDQTREGLIDYTSAQVANLCPDGRNGPVRERIAEHVDEALARIGHCIDAVRMWRQGEFSHLHSSQYCIYLYYLANTIWRESGDRDVCTRLFLLNKALNGIDLFYEIEMPGVFFIGHSVGIVLAKATYGERLVLYQNSTVGKNHGVAPVLGEGVVMYPNTAIIGRSVVEDDAVISQGTSVVNRHVPKGMTAFPGEPGKLAFRPRADDLLQEYFRL